MVQQQEKHYGNDIWEKKKKVILKTRYMSVWPKDNENLLNKFGREE